MTRNILMIVNCALALTVVNCKILENFVKSIGVNETKPDKLIRLHKSILSFINKLNPFVIFEKTVPQEHQRASFNTDHEDKMTVKDFHCNLSVFEKQKIKKNIISVSPNGSLQSYENTNIGAVVGGYEGNNDVKLITNNNVHDNANIMYTLEQKMSPEKETNPNENVNSRHVTKKGITTPNISKKRMEKEKIGLPEQYYHDENHTSNTSKSTKSNSTYVVKTTIAAKKMSKSPNTLPLTHRNKTVSHKLVPTNYIASDNSTTTIKNVMRNIHQNTNNNNYTKANYRKNSSNTTTQIMSSESENVQGILTFLRNISKIRGENNHTISLSDTRNDNFGNSSSFLKAIYRIVNNNDTVHKSTPIYPKYLIDKKVVSDYLYPYYTDDESQFSNFLNSDEAPLKTLEINSTKPLKETLVLDNNVPKNKLKAKLRVAKRITVQEMEPENYFVYNSFKKYDNSNIIQHTKQVIFPQNISKSGKAIYKSGITPPPKERKPAPELYKYTGNYMIKLKDDFFYENRNLKSPNSHLQQLEYDDITYKDHEMYGIRFKRDRPFPYPFKSLEQRKALKVTKPYTFSTFLSAMYQWVCNMIQWKNKKNPYLTHPLSENNGRLLGNMTANTFNKYSRLLGDAQCLTCDA